MVPVGLPPEVSTVKPLLAVVPVGLPPEVQISAGHTIFSFLSYWQMTWCHIQRTNKLQHYACGTCAALAQHLPSIQKAYHKE